MTHYSNTIKQHKDVCKYFGLTHTFQQKNTDHFFCSVILNKNRAMARITTERHF